MNSSLRINYPTVNHGTDSTEIILSDETPNLLSILKPGESNELRRFFVTDATVATLETVSPFIAKFDDGFCGKDNLIILGSGEPYKTIESALEIIKHAIDAGFTRKDLFVAIGGGVICDLVAFSSSIFKRGAACSFIPTTLLSIIDASIGGKSGCDFNNYKNMIGTFFPAKSIFIFSEFIQSLSEEQYRSGLAEALKTALLYDSELYDLFKKQHTKIISRDKDILNEIIKRCVVAKSKVVAKDFTEKNIRMFLNYGHTFAHALESLAGLGNITHGDAVAWGIGRAITVSNELGLCKESYKKEILSTLELYGWDTNPIPSIIKGGAAGNRLISIMNTDKKNIDTSIRLVLQRGLNDNIIQTVDENVILSALK